MLVLHLYNARLRASRAYGPFISGTRASLWCWLHLRPDRYAEARGVRVVVLALSLPWSLSLMHF